MLFTRIMKSFPAGARLFSSRAAILAAVVAVLVLMGAGAAIYLGTNSIPSQPRPAGPQPAAHVALPVAPSPGYVAPDLPGGKRVEQPVLLCFVSSSSGPSIAQLPALDRVAQEHADVTVVVVAVGHRPGQAGEWLRSRGTGEELAALAVADSGASEARRWNVTAVPTTFVISAAGVVAWLRVGVAGYDEIAAALNRARGKS